MTEKDLVEAIAKAIDPDAWDTRGPHSDDTVEKYHRREAAVERVGAVLKAIKDAGYDLVKLDDILEAIEGGKDT